MICCKDFFLLLLFFRFSWTLDNGRGLVGGIDRVISVRPMKVCRCVFKHVDFMPVGFLEVEIFRECVGRGTFRTQITQG